MRRKFENPRQRMDARNEQQRDWRSRKNRGVRGYVRAQEKSTDGVGADRTAKLREALARAREATDRHGRFELLG